MKCFVFAIIVILLSSFSFNLKDDDKSNKKKKIENSNVKGDVILGKENWLFLSRNEIKSYLGEDSLSLSQMKLIEKELLRRQALYEPYGIKFYFGVAPTKISMYSQFLPDGYTRKNNATWGEKLTNYLLKNPKLKVVDIYSYLKEKQAQHKNYFYYKLDNHWNNLGGFYAANCFLETINKDFKKVTPNNIKKFDIDVKEFKGGNLIKMLGSKEDKYVDEMIELNCKKTCLSIPENKTGYPRDNKFQYGYEECRKTFLKDRPRLLLFSESFGKLMFPFISEQFSRSTKIFDRWEYKSNMDIVECENPNVVVLMVLESNLKTLVTAK